ncbi:TPA: mannosyl-glycoprotein endo-beta-N-acetylglucosamidase [Burkholderia multivorans]
MADSVVIREFLVALGFRVDEKGLKNFREGVEGATKGVVRLISTISGAALTVGAGVSAFASKLERLYFVAQRTGAAETSLKSLEFAARNFGVSSEQAIGTVENLARMLRNVPGSEGLLQQMGVQTRDANGNLRDSVDLLTDLGSQLARLPQYEANAYAGVFGIDENLLLAMRNGDFDKYVKQYREMSQSTGLDKASADAHKFMVSLRGLGTTFENLGIRVEGAMLQKIGPQLDRFQRWMEEHGDEVANRVADIANAFLRAADTIGPMLVAVADQFLALDKATDGWSTKLIFLAGIFKVLGGFQLVGGIWKMVAALRAMGAASTAASAAGAAGGAGGLLGRLLPFAARLAGGLGLLLHSDDLNKGEKDTLDRFQPREGQQWSADMAGPQGQPKSPPSSTDGGSLQRLADTAFGKLIARGEGDYNSVNRGKAGGYKSGTENLENMTVAQVMAAQRAQKFNAAGRYQIIKDTLAEAARSMGLKGDEKFDRGMQDRIFEQYLVNNKRRAISDYLSGKSEQLVEAIYATAKEWASVAVPKGMKTESGRISDGTMTFYDRSGKNKATIFQAQMEQALQNSRALYQQPQSAVAQMVGRGDVSRSVDVKQDVRIEVNGVSDPAAAGREVARQQASVANAMARDMRGVIA